MLIYVGLSPSIVVAPSNPGGIYVPPSVNVPSLGSPKIWSIVVASSKPGGM